MSKLDQTVEERNDTLDGVSALVMFLRAHPDFPIPYVLRSLYVFVDTKEEFKAAVKALPGSIRKEPQGDYYVAVAKFGEVAVNVSIAREQVCRPVVVGKKTIPAQPERVVDKIEWVCEDPILK